MIKLSAQLREAGVLLARRNGTWMFYRINSDLDGWVLETLQVTLDGVDNKEPFVSDKKMLEHMANRSGLVCCK